MVNSLADTEPDTIIAVSVEYYWRFIDTLTLAVYTMDIMEE